MFSSLYYCQPEKLPKLIEAMGEAREAAQACNKYAHDVRSDRETRIRIYPSILNYEDVEMGMRYAEATYRRLLDLKEVYVSEPYAYRNTWVTVRYAWQAVVGKQRDVLRKAVESAAEQRKNGLMIYHSGGRRGTVDLRKAYPDEKRIPALDYGPIDEAIKMFSRAKDWSVRTP